MLLPSNSKYTNKFFKIILWLANLQFKILINKKYIMGGCCQKLESIDHVESLEDLKYIIQTDLELFKKQNKTLIEDKVNFSI